MATLSTTAKALRSKNAGPFWVTIDIFLPDDTVFEQVSASLTTDSVADALQLDPRQLKRYDLGEIAVIKFSFPVMLFRGIASIVICMELSMHCCLATLNAETVGVRVECLPRHPSLESAGGEVNFCYNDLWIDDPG